MRNSKLLIFVSSVILCLILFNCFGSSNKAENAKDDVKAANKNLMDENKNYLSEIEDFKIKITEELTINERTLADFNKRIATQNSVAKADYEKKIAELTVKNSEMRKKLNNIKSESKDNWEMFKKQFNNDMKDLGSNIKDLNSKN